MKPRAIPDDYYLLPAIMNEVAKLHRVRIEHFLSPRRDRRTVRARQEFCWRAVKETRCSRVWIGRFLQRNHATVIHSIREFEKRQAEQVTGG